MVESRCGILCSACEFRQQGGCNGCMQIQKPFWSEPDGCPVKNCVEGKKLEHCGQCPEVPCALLHSFAYHPEQGDDGKRIAQCITWAKDAATV